MASPGAFAGADRNYRRMQRVAAQDREMEQGAVCVSSTVTFLCLISFVDDDGDKIIIPNTNKQQYNPEVVREFGSRPSIGDELAIVYTPASWTKQQRKQSPHWLHVIVKKSILVSGLTIDASTGRLNVQLILQCEPVKRHGAMQQLKSMLARPKEDSTQ